MKKIINYLAKDMLTLAGLMLVILSASVFVILSLSGLKEPSFGAFFFNYVLTVGFMIAVFIRTLRDHKWRLSAGKTEHTVLMLVLWFISAFALNLEMNVFEDSVPWLCALIIVSTIALMLAACWKQLSRVFKYVVFFFLGAALLLFMYYGIYLLPLYAMSVIGIIAIGISLHTFVPLCLTIITANILVKACRQDKATLYAAASGFLLPLIGCIIFIVSWGQTNRQINVIINQNTLNEGKLPAWIAVSRHIKSSPIAERILKAGLIYHEVSLDENFFWGGMPTHSFDGKKQHDPLVVMATLFYRKSNLDEQERINILKAMYNSRHQAQERLWSGDNLETISVISNVKLFPEYRMAYTEKTLTVRNNSQWEWGRQEAIYTFHLSEGSVISSLSLWIDGKEAKSRLTTKAKADSAYKQIVGAEQRDPSVVHWQEGNTVTVRVFPCDTRENRRFRLGITSPLRKEGSRLVYENVSFDGPQAGSALETLQLSFSNKPANLLVPSVFKQTGADVYSADKTYAPDWEISFDTPPLSAAAFAFADTTYQVKDYQPRYEAFTPAAVYLDVNSAWSKDELSAVYNKVKEHPVYVYYDKLVKLSDNNIDDLYALLSSQNFSLFPLNMIGDADNALVISKSDGSAPNLTDLDGSGFASDLTAWLKTPRHIRLYNIGYQLTPYLKALKELRVFNYTNGNIDGLSALLDKHLFIRDQENASTVVIDNAGLMIQKVPGAVAQNAPDHLLRLFAYNDIMKKVGADYFNHNYVQPPVISEAEQAYVVSPVSSLIVLETQQDYQRFGIDENKNSLKNASMKSSGAVPEPQEWMLIILAAAVLVYLIARQKLAIKQA